MKLLPYFNWYPSDALSDEVYASMTDEELGFYHRCLNHSWINDGLPSDRDALARLMRMPRERLDKLWKVVGQKWAEADGRLRNSRQEEERNSAAARHKERSESGKKGMAKRWSAKTDSSVITEQQPSYNSAITRAYDSVSESVSSTEKPIRREAPVSSPKGGGAPSSRFPEFWSKYPRKAGENGAMSAWISVVTVENEELVFACLDRFLASGDVERGAVPYAGPSREKSGWLLDCSRDNWKSDWPKAQSRKPDQSQNGTTYTRVDMPEGWKNA